MSELVNVRSQTSDQDQSELDIHRLQPQHNVTEIQCNATLSNGESLLSEKATLLLQGKNDNERIGNVDIVLLFQEMIV